MVVAGGIDYENPKKYLLIVSSGSEKLVSFVKSVLTVCRIQKQMRMRLEPCTYWIEAFNFQDKKNLVKLL
jgi:hypothetical protein